MTPDKMNEELKSQWTAALRSGERKQGQYQMKTKGENSQYCCLGVLAEICEIPQQPSEVTPHMFFRFSVSGLFSGLPPIEWLESVGISQDARDHLTNMNDGCAQMEVQSFSVIADWIDENL